MKKIINLIKIVPLIFSLVLALTTIAMALDYPSKQIQIIVPYPPGGTNDIVARILGPKLASIFGQPVIIVNKPGGGSTVGIQFASVAKPDGYTILTSPGGIVLAPLLNPGIGFKLEDFSPICIAVSSIFVVAVKSDAPWKTLEDVIKEAKKNPGKLTYSSAGYGTAIHFYGELFKIETGTNIIHVPMTGEAGALAGVLGGHVDMSFLSKTLVSPHINTGTLRALVVTDSNRIRDFPDIPTTTEMGYPKLVICTGFHGYFFPTKTPQEIVEKVAKAFEAALKDKEVINSIDKTGMIIKGLILEDASKFVQNDAKQWAEVVKKVKMEEGLGK